MAAPLVVAEGILRKEEIFVAPQVSNCTKLYLCIVRHTGFYRFYSSPSPLLGAWRLPGEAGEKEELEEPMSLLEEYEEYMMNDHEETDEGESDEE